MSSELLVLLACAACPAPERTAPTCQACPYGHASRASVGIATCEVMPEVLPDHMFDVAYVAEVAPFTMAPADGGVPHGGDGNSLPDSRSVAIADLNQVFPLHAATCVMRLRRSAAVCSQTRSTDAFVRLMCLFKGRV